MTYVVSDGGFRLADGSNHQPMAIARRTGDASAEVRRPQRTRDKLEQAEGYQAPPREGESVDTATPTEADEHVDITVVDSKKQRPGLQTSETVESGQDSSPVPTCLGKDEIADRHDSRVGGVPVRSSRPGNGMRAASQRGHL